MKWARVGLAQGIVLCLVAVGRAQDAASPQAVYFVGPAAARTSSGTHAALQAGLELDEAPPNSWAGFFFEGAYLRDTASHGLFSVDYMPAWHFGPSGRGKTKHGVYWHDMGWRWLPFALVGYTRITGVGNALNFGGGTDYRFSHTRAIRVELRDYHSHSRDYIGLRVGIVLYLAD